MGGGEYFFKKSKVGVGLTCAVVGAGTELGPLLSLCLSHGILPFTEERDSLSSDLDLVHPHVDLHIIRKLCG